MILLLFLFPEGLLIYVLDCKYHPLFAFDLLNSSFLPLLVFKTNRLSLCRETLSIPWEGKCLKETIHYPYNK